MPGSELYEKTVAEHGVVRDLAAKLQQTLSAPETAGWLSRASVEFEHLRAHLVKLFALEEREGYMKTAAAGFPERGAEIELLRSEHAALTVRLNELMTRFRGASESAGSFAPHARIAVQALVDEIRRHESREIQFLQHLFNTDLAGND